MIFIDIILINISVLISYFMRFGKSLPLSQIEIYMNMAFFVTLNKLIVFYAMGLYKPIWKYAGLDDIITIFMSVCVANGIIIVFIYLLQLTQVPRSIYLIATLADFMFIMGSRFSKRIFNRFTNKDFSFYFNTKTVRVMIIGGGEAGGLLIQELRNHPKRGLIPICIIDDNTDKRGRKLNGVPIVGTTSTITYFVKSKRIDQIIIAIPSIKKDALNHIVDECKKTKCQIKILPFVNQIQDLKGNVSDVLVKKMRDVDIEDLLGRDEIILNTDEIVKYIKDKIILVTGGGGSIGSELCRQIASYNPKLLIIIEIYENNVYDIQNELLLKYPSLNLKCLIASIRERETIFSIFEKYKPNIVFHAAAHKHVPLMEDSPKEAIKNNIFGTFNVVLASDKYHVERFIQISTDKAVNPTNVMGATKRVCEMIVQAYAKNSNTNFVAVRFGNVLGSNGSVIPVFKKQIAEGGPVRVTHPDIIRYFMTISEAVYLVLKAGSIAKGGEIFVLDMGEQVKIDKLARDLIKLSGFEPDEDIKIVYTGLRPGEKLYEELLMAEEGISKTDISKIHIAKPMNITLEELHQKFSILQEALTKTDEDIIEALQKVVSTYKKQ